MSSGSTSGNTPVSVRLAVAEDVPAIGRVLASAFSDYPFLRHTVAADDHAERVRRGQELMVGRIALPHGRVWLAESGGSVVGAAAWTTPDTDVEAAFGPVAAEVGELAGDRAAIAASVEEALTPHRPTEPVWFLATIGIDPSWQGRGVGGALLRPGLAAAEEAGSDAFLETSDERNVRFYQRHGFRVVAEVDLPSGGPRTWAMRRVPAG
ncbi:N-acetyltransferase [Actinoalloteichus sp. AHMU CJ021]|uniref:Acetyltransferase (GNAT) family protein n=1 Tax=Actinoalloteichus caeruleus DSM 43889 TaxID=1120930 RepID=A0ABT1JK59_ACTCY|nr:GNAT family N-acetyltransferase [Actinoalloteichus caeruleus]AUS78467.1 N-acetyltransferase [Actinoalloteichus sp. AHMU CJ021]MCP2332564.1 Acetyltransferase (GNAT) family protein [Actinoalloteichus caeruleus DSM 43889]